MKKQYLISGLISVLFLQLTICGFSQNQLYKLVETQRQHLKAPAVAVSILQPANNPALVTQLNNTISGYDIYVLNNAAVSSLIETRPANISFNIPSAIHAFQLELIQQDINTSGDFSVNLLDGDKKTPMSNDQGLHYRGYVHGDPNSLASLSVFSNGDIMVLFSNAEGNYNLGKVKGTQNNYVLYQQAQMNAPLTFNCATSNLAVNEQQQENNNQPSAESDAPPAQGIPGVLCQKVRFYWEATNKLYFINFNSDTTLTKNYLTGVFNQVAAMYANEGIKVELASTSIWRTLDPYSSTTSSSALNDFRFHWNLSGDNFNGDIAMLVDGGSSNNGGIAYLLTSLCGRSYNYAYANVYGNYSSIPTYSWDVEVLTHEIGHNLGSHHTHWCGWMTGLGGSCGAIDDCYTLETSTNCTSCLASTLTNPTPPAGFKGSVMSYCHLRFGIGINLANGFGPLPQAVIRNVISGSNACLQRENLWTGAISTAWENPGNWSCNSIPDATTDVTLPSGLTNYPVVSSQAICRKLTQPAGTTVRVTTGFKLTVAGTN